MRGPLCPPSLFLRKAVHPALQAGTLGTQMPIIPVVHVEGSLRCYQVGQGMVGVDAFTELKY